MTMKTTAKIPPRLWVEFALYTAASVIIQILAHLAK